MKLFETTLTILSIANFGLSNYILTPKENLLNSNVFKQKEWKEFAEEHNLSLLAEFSDNMVFYTTDKESYNMYKNTLVKFYDIEEDQQISLGQSFTFKLGNEKSASEAWHLNRIVQGKNVDKTFAFPYSHPGQCHTNTEYVIDTYIVDTGIDINHPQFEGRAKWLANFADGIDRDCNNHGTHVAGLVGSKDYGVCVDANLYAIKVLTCEGSGSLSGVIRGIELAYQTHQTKTKASSKKVKSLINMSLGGGRSVALNKAVEACVANDPNFYVVVAAGNEDNDACDTSPAGVSSVLTVMASDSSDNRAWFSNWGRCANVYSPGVDILSTFPDNKTATISGTSMASPVMAGVLNHYIDMFPEYTMADMLDYVKKVSTKNVIYNNKKYTKNYFVYLNRV